ncbi:hypothetical protein TNCV_2672081 [Trichonephila clavipes]|nr:hypothetical protein TNCV_2672081 [Trichonephila clavipes]
MTTVDFLHQENTPTWAGVEPAIMDREGQPKPNQIRHPAGTVVFFGKLGISDDISIGYMQWPSPMYRPLAPSPSLLILSNGGSRSSRSERL